LSIVWLKIVFFWTTYRVTKILKSIVRDGIFFHNGLGGNFLSQQLFQQFLLAFLSSSSRRLRKVWKKNSECISYIVFQNLSTMFLFSMVVC